MAQRTGQTRFATAWTIAIGVLAAAVFTGAPVDAAAQTTSIVGDGGFETPATSKNREVLPAGSTALAPWKIGGDSISLVGSFWTAAEGAQSIDLDGNAPGSIAQTLATVPGKRYRLQFVYSQHPSLGGNAAMMTVQWGTSASPSYTEQFTFSGTSTKSDMGWITVRRTVQASSPSTDLSFTSNDAKNNNYGIALDAISVTPLPDQATLVITGPSSLTYGTTGTVTVTGGSGSGAPSISAGSSTGCTVSGTTVTVTNASGTCTLTATKAGSDDYQDATSASFPVTLVKADQATLTVNGPAGVTYGTTGAVTVSGGSGSGALSISAGTSTGCSVSGTTVSVSDASGACTLTATKAADGNYKAATSAPFPVTLQKANQATLAVTGPVSVNFGTTGTATASGGSGTGALNFSVAGGSTGCTLSGTTVAVTNGSGTCTLTATKAGDGNYNAAASAPFTVTLVPPPFATPVLIRAVATGDTGVYLIGRVDGATSLPITLQAYAAPTCTNGMLVGGGAVGAPLAATTDGVGYFGAQLAAGVTPGYFVAVKVTSPALTATSACLVSSADNDTWPKALQLSGATPTATLTARDYIDVSGRARWYKFDVLPGQRINVSLSGLPADYDLAVFKDIGTTFLKLTSLATTPDLTRLSAEYAPSAFSPSAFSPSAFSPSAFSPSAFSPSAFSPSAFSANVFSPSAFSPSAFSPSAFSPSAFSPSAFSPSAFSPSAFSPSAFSPSAFSPSAFSTDDFAMAFSSAQTRSIIGGSFTSGLGDELVVVNSWNNTGSFYVRVSGRSGAYSTDGQFQVTVEKGETSCANVTDPKFPARSPAPGAGIMTVILTDSSKVALGAALPGGGTLGGKLAAFAGRPEVAGTIVDVALDDRVSQLRTQAAGNAACPYATNLVAEEIKGIVDSYRANNPGLRYVVIAGNDDAIPFFRYPDQSLLGQESGYVPPVKSDSASEASLRLDYVLSQDAYGAGTRVSLRTSDYPVPGLAVGRLVESPEDMAGLIDAYTATGGVVVPGSSLVTGYDFLADAADAVTAELQQGTNAQVDRLVTANGISPEDSRSWTAVDLATKLFSGRHDVIFLAGHFSANSALAADFSTNLITTDLAASTTDFVNSIVFSAGCHSGYNLVDGAAIPGVTLPLDWAQAFAQKKATLIAGTGYQYGDTDFVEYSERLYRNFARQLRAGTGAVAVGEALVRAKIDYLASTPDVRGIHEKALLEATLFGLPMLGVNMPGGRGAIPGPGPGITPTPVLTMPAASLGLRTADLAIAPTLTLNSAVLTSVEQSGNTVTATWLSGPDGVVSNPVEPALPLVVRNATATDPSVVLRGVGFRGGTYSDTTVVPLTGAATTELRGVHVPFVSPVFFPMRPWTVNYYGALAGNGATSLLVTPAQHRAADIAQAQSTRRQFSNLDLRLYYSGKLTQAAVSDAPSIVSVIALPSGSGVEFTAQIVGDPAAAMHEAWITWTDGGGAWTPLDLAQCGAPVPAVCGTTHDSSIWKARLPFVPSNLRYVIQAANGYGLVTFDDNRGIYYGLGGSAQTGTALTFASAPASSAKFGDDVTVSVALASGGAPVAGKSVTVAIGGAARVGTTDANGQSTVTVPAVTLPGNYKIVASFAGDDALLGSAASAAFQVQQATSNLAALTVANISSSTLGATLTATLGTKIQPLLQESVRFALSGAAGSRTVYSITDYRGRAFLPPTGLPAGSYSLTAAWPGNATYAPATSAPQNFEIAAQTISFGGAGLPDSIAYPGSVTFTVASNAGQPVTVGLTVGSSLFCLLTGPGPTYTLTALAPGICTLFASANGTVTYADVTVTKDITITKGEQSIGFAALPDRGYGDASFPVAATGGVSGNPVTFSVAAGTTACAVSGSTVSILAVGTCTIVADQAGNTFYNAAPSVAQSFVVNPRQVTVTADAKTKVYGTADPALTYRVTAGSLVNGDGFAGVLTRAAGENVGSYAIQKGTLALSANYALTFVGANLTIVPRPITVTADAKTKAYGTADPAFTWQLTGGSLAGGDAFAGALTRDPGETAGTYAIKVGTLTLGGNYTIAYVGAKLTITAQAITVTADAKSKAYGAADPALTFQVTSGSLRAGDSLSGALTRDSGESVGAYAIRQGTLTAGANYAITYAGADFTIVKADQTIAFPTVASPTFVANGTFTVKATASSGLIVSFASLTPGSCTVTGATPTLSGGVTSISVTMVAGGLCTLQAAQNGNANYKAAPVSPVQSFTIAKGAQTITFAPPGDKAYGDAPFQVSATSSSGLAVAFTAAGSCTLAGAGTPPVSPVTVTLTSTGKCTLTASQGGDSSYLPATNVARTLAINLRDVYTAVGSMGQPRSYHTATLFDSGPLAGWVLVAGGLDARGAPTATGELYDPVTHTFSPTGNLPSKAAGHTATLLPDGKVIVLGGGNSSAETFDPVTETWSPAGSLSSTRSFHTATVLGDGTNRVLVAGGADNSGKAIGTTLLYNPADGSVTAGPDLSTARERHTATLLPNGKVLVAGGRAKSGNSYNVLATAEVCDAAACVPVTVTGLTARHSHGAVALSDGTVLLVGGAGATADLQTAEVLTLNTSVTPPTATVASTAGLQTNGARRELTATALPNGHVLVAGGQNGTTPKALSDLYGPPLVAGAPMHVPRAGHTATQLRDAAGNVTNVLFIGGVSGSAAASTASAEVYGGLAP